MKLFQRTLLSFFGIIMVQGALTIALVADRIANSQSEDAWRELRSEALIVYDNVNSWKRLLWKEAVDLHEDEELSAIIGLQRSIAFDSLLRSYLSIVSERSGADFLIIRSSGSHFNISMNLSGKNLPIPPERFFLNTRNHPYIDTIVLEQTLYFVGTTRCTADNGNAIDIFLIKRLDEALCVS
ncbi:hypothetical protein MASR2M78_36960 [Treponema sp.]